MQIFDIVTRIENALFRISMKRVIRIEKLLNSRVINMLFCSLNREDWKIRLLSRARREHRLGELRRARLSVHNLRAFKEATSVSPHRKSISR